MDWLAFFAGAFLMGMVWLVTYCRVASNKWLKTLTPEQIEAVRKSGEDEGFYA